MQVSNLSSLCSPLIIPPSSPVCFICLPVSAPAVPPPPSPPPLPAGSNSCGRKWRAKVSSHCSICTPARAPVSRLTPAHSSFSAPNYPRRRSMLQSAVSTRIAGEAVKRDSPQPENGSFITFPAPRSVAGDMF